MVIKCGCVWSMELLKFSENFQDVLRNDFLNYTYYEEFFQCPENFWVRYLENFWNKSKIKKNILKLFREFSKCSQNFTNTLIKRKMRWEVVFWIAPRNFEVLQEFLKWTKKFWISPRIFKMPLESLKCIENVWDILKTVFLNCTDNFQNVPKNFEKAQFLNCTKNFPSASTKFEMHRELGNM